MPVAVITFAYLAISSVTYFLNSLTGIATVSTPWPSSFVFSAGIGDAGADRRVQLLDDLVRRAGGRAHAVPAGRRIARHEFGDGGNIRRGIRTRRRGDADGDELAGSDVLDDLHDRRKRDRNLSAEQIGHVAALVRHLHHVGAGHHLEQFAGHMRPGADAGRRDVELAGIGLGIGDQLGHRFHRKLRIDHDDERGAADGADRREVAGEIEIQMLIKRGVDGIGRDDEEERIAVRRGVGDDFGADIAGGARPIVDDELLTEAFRHRLRHQARDNVGRQTGRKTDDDVHRPGRIIERRRAARRQRQRGGARGQLQKFAAFHVLLPF